ncbi:MAG: hypothetical protein MPL62_13275 [Alphaproteobacteria bacterium]|nr:hypothetical protein [Alphaproteobacteria bacterium]
MTEVGVPFPHYPGLGSSSSGALGDERALTLARLEVGESQDTGMQLVHVV